MDLYSRGDIFEDPPAAKLLPSDLRSVKLRPPQPSLQTQQNEDSRGKKGGGREGNCLDPIDVGLESTVIQRKASRHCL